MSGGRSYGKKKPRYCRAIKSVFKTGALANVFTESETNPIRQYYLNLLGKPGYSEEKARRIAVITLGVFKSNTKFKNNWRSLCSSTV